MNLQVLSILTTASLIGFSSCNSNPNRVAEASSWRFPFLGETPGESRIGRQMPPHHEPDAVLINVNGNGGEPGMPEGGYPGGSFPGNPGVFGIPGDPRAFGFPGVNVRPGVFGTPERPNVFGMPRLPGFPNTFGVPGFQQGDAGVYGSAFVPPQGQRGPRMPAGVHLFGIGGHQSGPEFSVRTGVFGRPSGPLKPDEQSFAGQQGIFTVAGSGNFPFSGSPGFFFPGRGPKQPGGTDGFPVTRGVPPETFMPRSGGNIPDIFVRGGILPGPRVYFPEAPAVPNQPGDFDGYFPRRESEGGRETFDDPTADSFPLINATS